MESGMPVERIDINPASMSNCFHVLLGQQIPGPRGSTSSTSSRVISEKIINKLPWLNREFTVLKFCSSAFNRLSRCKFSPNPPNQARTIKWPSVAWHDGFPCVCHKQLVFMGPHRMELISRFSPASGFIIQSFILVANAASAPLWTHHKSDHFQSFLGPERLVDSVLVLGFAVDPISSPPVFQLTTKYLGHHSFCRYSRTSSLNDLSHRSQVAAVLVSASNLHL